jgi:hypothetical protein
MHPPLHKSLTNRSIIIAKRILEPVKGRKRFRWSAHPPALRTTVRSD